MAFDYNALLLAAQAAVTGHTWSLITAPAVYRGLQLDVDKVGPVVIVVHMDEAGENAILPGNIAREELGLCFWGGVPWDDNNREQNVTDIDNLATELKSVIKANRHLGGVNQAKIKAVRWGKTALVGPVQSGHAQGVKSYRSVAIVVMGLVHD